ncbi:MAG: sporulation transcription factor Spo0A [Christensenellaceae bacterium]|nr:sporulation transcription factor Spo0A [Christensenellaceae bacterium]
METIRVLIAEDNALQRSLLADGLDGHSGIQIVGAAANGLDALEMIQRLHPQVLLLDMVLPSLDGFGLLEKLQQFPASQRPAVIATTSLGRDDFITRAMELSVAYYMVKPLDMAFLTRQILSAVHREAPVLSAPAPPPDEPEDIERLATAMLMQIGVPAHLSGYKFIRSALMMVTDRPELFSSLTRVLYPEIAREFGTTASCVERAIRHAISLTWDRGGGENYRKLLGRQASTIGDKPTNSEFLAQVGEGIRLRRGRHGR